MDLRRVINKSYMFFLAITMLLLGIGCDNIVEEIPEVAVIELNSGYSIQLTASPDVQWGSENPAVATVSSTGLVTAVGAGKTTIYTYTSADAQTIVCYLEVFPKRNMLFYIATDNNGLDNGSGGDEPKEAINNIRAGWKPGIGEMLIYTDQTNRPPCLMRINETPNANGLYGLDTIKVFEEHNSADAAVFKRIVDTVVMRFPADSYGMIFFSHASGWLPEGMLAHPRSSETNQLLSKQYQANQTDAISEPRSIGIDKGDGASREMTYQAFAAAIPENRFDMIIFEACFMADVMFMYELRNKTEYVVASSAEVVSPGFTPLYKEFIMQLYDTKKPAFTVISDFAKNYTDYITNTFPETSVFCSATMGVIKMSEMQNLANTVKSLLNGKKLNESTLQINEIQRFDRPSKLISSGQRKDRFFDFGHAMKNVLSNSEYVALQTQLDKTVVWKANTKRFLLSEGGFFIEHHSGLSIYIEQAVYPQLNTAYRNSAWYKAIYD